MHQFNAFAQTRYGGLIYNRNDQTIGRSIELYGEFCQRAVRVFDQVLQPGQIVLDVGANIGVHSMYFAKKIGPTGRLLAMEPQRLLFQVLCGNMALNSITNSHCWNMAAGAVTGEVAVPAIDYYQPGDFSRLRFDGPAEGESIAVVTVDSLELPRCEFIRVAIRGLEEQILRGAAETIVRFRPILYVECDAGDDLSSALQFLDSLGYSLHWHQPELFNPDNYAGNADNVFGAESQKNLFGIDNAVDQHLTGFTPVDISDAA